jgi:hypothetical protein
MMFATPRPAALLQFGQAQGEESVVVVHHVERRRKAAVMVVLALVRRAHTGEVYRPSPVFWRWDPIPAHPAPLC